MGKLLNIPHENFSYEFVLFLFVFHLPMTPPKLESGDCSHGDGTSFLDEPLSSSNGPLLASLSAFWLRLSEKASSLKEKRH